MHSPPRPTATSGADEVIDQVQGCMWITGRKWWHIGMYCPLLKPVGLKLWLQSLSATPIETCRHQLALYENEFEELNLQLRQAREQIFKLVEMHAAAATDRDQLRTELAAAKSEAADANRRATDIETKTNWELMAKDRHISHLVTEIKTLKGEDPFAPPFPHKRDKSCPVLTRRK